MDLPNTFEKNTLESLKNRIEKLSENIEAQWGSMNSAQMLAHCNVTYEMVFEDFYQKPNFINRWILRKFVKPIVVSDKPYKKNSQTAPQFKIKEEKNFDEERERLFKYLNKTQELGEVFFNNKESHSLGKLSANEWNNMFYKHLDHHLKQFGV